jgi:predicted secreted protein
MFDDTGRRRFLQLAGTGTAASLAGCNALSQQDGDGAGDDAGGDAEPATVTLAVRPDQQSLQQLQSEIQEQVQSGELDPQQAQAQFRRRRTELTRDAVDTFRNRTGNASVSVDDTVAEFGVLLVTGDPSALIETLGFEEVNGLFAASTFEQARTQAETSTAGGSDSTTASGDGSATPMG